MNQDRILQYNVIEPQDQRPARSAYLFHISENSKEGNVYGVPVLPGSPEDDVIRAMIQDATGDESCPVGLGYSLVTKLNHWLMTPNVFKQYHIKLRLARKALAAAPRQSYKQVINGWVIKVGGELSSIHFDTPRLSYDAAWRDMRIERQGWSVVNVAHSATWAVRNRLTLDQMLTLGGDVNGQFRLFIATRVLQDHAEKMTPIQVAKFTNHINANLKYKDGFPYDFEDEDDDENLSAYTCVHCGERLTKHWQCVNPACWGVVGAPMRVIRQNTRRKAIIRRKGNYCLKQRGGPKTWHISEDPAFEFGRVADEWSPMLPYDQKASRICLPLRNFYGTKNGNYTRRRAIIKQRGSKNFYFKVPDNWFIKGNMLDFCWWKHAGTSWWTDIPF